MTFPRLRFLSLCVRVAGGGAAYGHRTRRPRRHVHGTLLFGGVFPPLNVCAGTCKGDSIKGSMKLSTRTTTHAQANVCAHARLPVTQRSRGCRARGACDSASLFFSLFMVCFPRCVPKHTHTHTHAHAEHVCMHVHGALPLHLRTLYRDASATLGEEGGVVAIGGVESRSLLVSLEHFRRHQRRIEEQSCIDALIKTARKPSKKRHVSDTTNRLMMRQSGPFLVSLFLPLRTLPVLGPGTHPFTAPCSVVRACTHAPTQTARHAPLRIQCTSSVFEPPCSSLRPPMVPILYPLSSLLSFSTGTPSPHKYAGKLSWTRTRPPPHKPSKTRLSLPIRNADTRRYRTHARTNSPTDVSIFAHPTRQ